MRYILYSEAGEQIAEFSHWVPRAVAHYWPSTQVTVDEPGAPLTYNGQRLVPLIDELPEIAPWQKVASRTITDRGDSALAVYALTDKDLAEYRTEREAWAAEHRWTQMEAGLVWQRGGEAYGLATDAVSRANIAAERAAAEAGLRVAGDPWKCLDIATGQAVFLDLTDAEVIDISTRVRAHVVGLFRAEREFVAAICAAETVEDVAAVELAI